MQLLTSLDLVDALWGKDRPLLTVLDVGAIDIGEDAPYANLVRAGLARVVGFEPDAKGCDALNRKWGEPHQFLPHFVGDGEEATFFETNWAPTGSLFKPNRPVLEAFQNLHELVTLVAEHSVHTVRLDDMVDLDDVDLIKIDVQGAELAVFRGGAAVLERALMVWTEVEFVSLYENQPLFADVDICLREAGYQFHTFVGFGNRCFKPLIVNNDLNQGMRQMLWADAVYVRDWLRLDRLSEEKLKRLALLCHEVLKSFDLCHRILSALDARSGSAVASWYLEGLTQPQAQQFRPMH